MRLFCISLLLWWCGQTQAVVDAPEQFIVDGVAHDVETNPLEKLYPADELRSKLAQYCAVPQKNYQGTWELKDQQLFLNNLRQNDCKTAVNSIDPQLLFKQKQYPLKASWFNGAIKVALTEKDYKYCLTKEGSDQTIGYAYLAMVYEFIDGKLIKQSEQLVTENWQRPRSQCAKVPTARV